jgi:SAM-dependent methyltransferase
MASPTDAACRPFRAAAAHYLSGRPPYPDRLIRRVARQTGLTAADRVLDLGCGPAMLAAAFAAFAGEVIGLDPEPEMLRVGQAAFGRIGNLRLVRGSSDELSPELGAFRLVVMGRSFAWMDRQETLRALDPLIVPGGAIALFDSQHRDELPDNGWNVRYRAVRHRYGAPNAANPRRTADGWIRHEAILLDSAFSVLESAAVIERRRTDAAELVHRARSMSSTTPDRLGEAAVARLSGEIEELVRMVAPDGVLTEVVESTALIARRPGESDD